MTYTYTLFVRVWTPNGKHSTIWRCDNPTNGHKTVNHTPRNWWKGKCKAS